MSTVPPGPVYPQPWPAPVPPRRSTSTTGPKVSVAVGAVLLVGAILAGVLGARAFLGIMPTDVMRMDGSPGPGVLAEIATPGSAEVMLPADSRFTLLLVRHGQNTGMATTTEPRVTSPREASVDVGGPDVSLTVTMGDSHAEAIASFRTGVGGVHRIDAPSTVDGEPASLHLVESDGVGGFVGGLFGGIAGVLAAVFLGIVAVALLIAGGIMWSVRRGNARQQAGPSARVG